MFLKWFKTSAPVEINKDKLRIITSKLSLAIWPRKLLTPFQGRSCLPRFRMKFRCDLTGIKRSWFSKEAKISPQIAKQKPGQMKLSETENCFDVSGSWLFSPRLIVISSEWYWGGNTFRCVFSHLGLSPMALTFTLGSPQCILCEFTFTYCPIESQRLISLYYL